MSDRTKYIVLIICGIVAALIEFNSMDPQKPIVVVIVMAFPFGFFFPEKAWRYPLVIGLCFPLLNLFALILGAEPQYFQVIQSDYPQVQYDIIRVLETGIALVPAFLGTYAGVGIHWFLQKRSN